MKFFATMLLVFTALTAVMTYPQAFHLRDSVHDDGDPLMCAWALAWVGHQLPYAPAHLLDANIFYPERRTLAYSETLLLPGIVFAPLQWNGGGPILVYNIVFLSALIVSGAGAALLVRSLTGSAGAALLSGIVFAFLPYRIDHQPHLQLQQTQCLPFALWAFHRMLGTRRVRDGILFGLFSAGQVLSCMYYGLFLIPYFTVVCGALLIADRGTTSPPMIALASGVLVALIAVAPLGRAYLGVRQVVGERPAQVVEENSATLDSYLAVPEANRLYGGILRRFFKPERQLFPGFVAIALTICALWPRSSERGIPKRTILAYALGLVVAFDVSLGFHGATYRVLYEYVLPFRGLRVPARMGVLVGFSLAVLAGFGAARLGAMLESPSARRALIATLAAAMLAEYASRPLELQKIPLAPPAAYADLMRDRGDSPNAAVFEFPTSALDDPTYMYYSTFHWQSLVNGYSGFFPPSYVTLVDSMRDFPDEASITAIRTHAARYLLVHGERLFGARYEEIIADLGRRSDLTLVSRSPAEREGQHGEISLYRLSYAPPR